MKILIPLVVPLDCTVISHSVLVWHWFRTTYHQSNNNTSQTHPGRKLVCPMYGFYLIRGEEIFDMKIHNILIKYGIYFRKFHSKKWRGYTNAGLFTTNIIVAFFTKLSTSRCGLGSWIRHQTISGTPGITHPSHPDEWLAQLSLPNVHLKHSHHINFTNVQFFSQFHMLHWSVRSVY